MALAEILPVARTSITVPDLRPRQRRLVRAVGAAWNAMSAGWRAAAEYRRLSALSDRQLGQRGLSRGGIPQVLRERHFAGLGS